MKNILNWIMLLSLTLFCMGCSSAHKVTREVGKPIGGATRVIEGVSEGATEGYINTGETSEENPYGR